MIDLLVEDYRIKKGDRVAIGARNYPEWIIAFLAITSVGGIAVCLNALWNVCSSSTGESA
jgi:long-chain acyl-CoA synthetase